MICAVIFMFFFKQENAYEMPISDCSAFVCSSVLIGIFFPSLGITWLKGYGQTEGGPGISCNRARAGLKMDTGGPPLKNTEVRIADDGEILVRGELVMKGYWRNERETDRVLADDWLHTGDIGVIDEQGRIKITDRKKDLIVNDKGENVAPQKVEEIGRAHV